MRIVSLGLVLTALALVLATTATGRPEGQSLTGSCAKANLSLKTPGRLSLATDNPAFPPWWGGGQTRKPWKTSNPYSGKGYESAVAYAVAKQLGFSRREVTWTPVPFAQSYRPGPKSFDFYMAQVSYSKERDQVVDFSSSYYYVKQALVTREGNALARARSIAAVRPFKLGAQLGTTSYQYIVRYVKPTTRPLAFDTNDLAVQALQNGQIDGIVVDLPTTYYVTDVQVEDAVIVGQFRNQGAREQLGMVFERDSKLRRCVNRALNQLWVNETMKALQKRWLSRVGIQRVLR